MTAYFVCTYVYTHDPSRFLWDPLHLANNTFSCPSWAVQWLTIRKFFPAPGHGGLAKNTGALDPSLRGRIKLVHRQEMRVTVCPSRSKLESSRDGVWTEWKGGYRGSQGSLSTFQGVTSRGDHHHCTPPLHSLVRDVRQEIRKGESVVPGSHRLGETEARCEPASLCEAYILLQSVHRGCDLCGSWLPVAFSQGAVQVLLQLLTQLRRAQEECQQTPPPPTHTPSSRTQMSPNSRQLSSGHCNDSDSVVSGHEGKV